MYFGNDYLVIIKKETVYGTNPGTLASGSSILNKTIEFTPGTEVLETKGKTLRISNVIESYVQGREMPTCTISGELDEASLIAMLNAICDNTKIYGATGSWFLPTARSPYSFTIAKYFKAGSAAGRGQIMTGAVCSSLKLSIPASGPITFQATFRGKSLDMDLGSITGTMTPSNGTTVFQSGDITEMVLEIGGTPTDSQAMQLELDLTRELADDNVSYGISFSRQREITLRTGGTAQYTGIWTNSSGWVEPGSDTVFAGFDLTGSVSTYTYSFSIRGIIQSSTLPDPDRGVYQVQHQITLADVTTANDLFECEVPH